MTLQSELNNLEAVIGSYLRPDEDACTTFEITAVMSQVKIECIRITEAWKCAVFSDAHDQSLQRYFNIHLEDIRDLSDTLLLVSGEDKIDQDSLAQVNSLLLSLVTQMQTTHVQHFDTRANTPLLWRRRMAEKNKTSESSLIKKLESGSFNLPLKNCVFNYLTAIRNQCTENFCSYHSLNYCQLFLATLEEKLTPKSGDSELEALLISLNFNRMEYLKYHQSRIRKRVSQLLSFEEKIQELQHEQVSLFSFSVNRMSRCHDNYGAIDDMLDSWLSEQLGIQERAMDRVALEGHSPVKIKIPLRLSVAQIAYVIRLLVDTDFLNEIPLVHVFQFVCDNFSSKRRELITLSNLSKEYYSVTQFTAARVLAWFEKTAAKIIRDFFPLLAAVSLTSFFS